MTMQQINAYYAYFRKHPPTHYIAAWVSGWKPPKDPAAGQSTLSKRPAFSLLPSKEE
jgi:hypothetical protein